MLSNTFSLCLIKFAPSQNVKLISWWYFISKAAHWWFLSIMIWLWHLSDNFVEFKRSLTRNNLSVKGGSKLRIVEFFRTRLPFCKRKISLRNDSFWQNLNIFNLLSWSSLTLTNLKFGFCVVRLPANQFRFIFIVNATCRVSLSQKEYYQFKGKKLLFARASVCVCVFVSFHRKASPDLKKNNKCNARLQASDVVLRKLLGVKYLDCHVIGNHSRDLPASNCARVSIKPGKATRSKRQLSELSRNQR